MVHKITEKVMIWEVLGCKLTFWPHAPTALEGQQSLQNPNGILFPFPTALVTGVIQTGLSQAGDLWVP